jgi:hypothetical protein
VERAAAQQQPDELSDDDRAWLEARLAEYAELLQYLNEH